MALVVTWPLSPCGGESYNLESRIERVSGLYFLEKLAGRLGKRDEHVCDVLGKERGPRSRDRQYLQAMHNRGYVSVTPCVLQVVANGMIVSRNGLEGRGVCIGKCAAWRPEDFANAQVFKRSRSYNGEVAGVKGLRVFGMSVVGFISSSFPSLFPSEEARRELDAPKFWL